LNDLDWPSSTKTMQAEWIGKSEGAHVDFALADAPVAHAGLPLRVFTTRPDTLFGATFMVVAPEHPLVNAVLDEHFGSGDQAAIRAYVEAARNRTDVERQENKEKTGVPLGIDAINPVNGKTIPVWTADYVLMGYGTGAIMAVPAQDERDYEFAETFGLDIVRTVQPPEDFDGKAYTGDGPAINSDFLNGMNKDDAKRAIIEKLEADGTGKGKTNYKLRDWLFSRQRYWGEPFPIVYDDRGNHHGVDESALPVVLPPMDDYQPVESDEPQPLLGKATDWVNTTAGEAGVAACPPTRTSAARRTRCRGGPGRAGTTCATPTRRTRAVHRPRGRPGVAPQAGRRQNTRRCREVRDSRPAVAQPGGVDLYVGGAEHAVLHLLYARFWHKVLFDLGEVMTPEPFQKLYHQGLILSHAYQRADKSLVPVDQVENRGTDDEPVYIETATGEAVSQIVAKMSKSLKNVVNPDDVIAEFGADTFRLYEMYMGPLDQSKPWDTRAIGGMFNFLRDTWRLCISEETGTPRLAESADPDIEKALHRTIAKVGADIEKLHFNTAIAAMIEFKNAATPKGGIKGDLGSLTKDQMDRFVRTLAPFAPHLADEIADRLGMLGDGSDKPVSLIQAEWPAYDEAMLKDDEVEIPVQILGKVRGKITVAADADAKAIEETALADDKIKGLIEGKTVRKVIVVPGRMVNIVAN
jgi:leucyl-tRNA synthetase